jgi:putative peptidoglycan lipid II flippase
MFPGRPRGTRYDRLLQGGAQSRFRDVGTPVIFNAEHIGLTGIWLLQGIISFAAQAVIAAYFGSGAALDAYLVGTTLPTTIYMITSSTLVAATTVYFNQVKAREGETAAFQSISGLLVVVFAGGIVLGVLLYAQADRIVGAIAPGLDHHATAKAAQCLQLTSMTPPFLAMYSLLTGFLNAQRMFFLTTLAGTVLVGLVPLPVLLGMQVTPEALSWGFNGGAVGAWALLFAVGLHGRRLRRGRILWSDWRQALSIGLPLLTAAGSVHVLWLIERYFASSFYPGTISALNYGLRIVNFIAGGLTFATSTLLLPYFSAWIEGGERARAAGFNRKTMAGTTLCTIAGLILLTGGGEWLVRLAYGRGRFDEAAIALTTTAVWLYLGIFIAYLYGVVINQHALAMQEKRVIVVSSSTVLLSYLVLAPLLMNAFGFKGLPLSASIAFMLGLAVSIAGMWRKHADFYWRPALKQSCALPDGMNKSELPHA